jgi:hypothetical protein
VQSFPGRRQPVGGGRLHRSLGAAGVTVAPPKRPGPARWVSQSATMCGPRLHAPGGGNGADIQRIIDSARVGISASWRAQPRVMGMSSPTPRSASSAAPQP